MNMSLNDNIILMSHFSEKIIVTNIKFNIIFI